MLLKQVKKRGKESNTRCHAQFDKCIVISYQNLKPNRLFRRYDVELYQRIEQLIGKKLPLYPTVEEEVLLLMERVTEAQRYAKMVRKYV